MIHWIQSTKERKKKTMTNDNADGKYDPFQNKKRDNKEYTVISYGPKK